MAKSKSLLILLLSVLLLFKIFTSSSLSRQGNLPTSNRVYNSVVLNLQLTLPKRDNEVDVFPAVGHTQRPAGRKTLPRRLQAAVINEEDMVTLTEKNFSDFMANNRHVMVVFYAPKWRFATSHATLTMRLTGAAVVAKVDFSEEKKLAEKYKLVRYPSIYFFPGGSDLADKYYNEVFLEGYAEAGKIRGKFVGRSYKDDQKTAVSEAEVRIADSSVENVTTVEMKNWSVVNEMYKEEN